MAVSRLVPPVEGRGRPARSRVPLGALLLVLVTSGCARPLGQADARAANERSPGAAGPAARLTEYPSLRQPAVAGAFYPGDPDKLRSFVSRELDAAQVPECPGRVVALIAPHAGYEYSGAVAAHAYRPVKGRHYDCVVLVGPSHRVPCAGAVLPESQVWATPLGEVRVDQELSAKLVEAAPDLFLRNDTPHAYEHSLEIQLPFLQLALDDFTIVPILLHDFSRETCDAVAEALAAVLKDRNVLLVASTDLAHYPPTGRCREVDLKTLGYLEKWDVDGLYRWEEEATGDLGGARVACTVCGLGPVVATLAAARELGADKVVRLKYTNSGQTDPATADRSVGYASLALCASKLPAAPAGSSAAGQAGGNARSSQKGESKMAEAPVGSTDNLNDEQKKRLLVLAREAITRWVTNHEEVKPPTDEPAFAPERAVFVTLRKSGHLRGCIGTLEPVSPLGEAVIESAISAATRDPRFRPVVADEIPALDIHVSVLSPMRTVSGPEEIVIGKHGIVVRQGMRSGVFLPEVATEQGWDLETTLTVLCTEKAGLPADAWKRGAELRVFTTQSFGEEDYGLGPHARH